MNNINHLYPVMLMKSTANTYKQHQSLSYHFYNTCLPFVGAIFQNTPFSCSKYLFFKTFTIHPAELRLYVHKGICTAGSAVTSNVRNGFTAYIICCTAEKNMLPTNTVDHSKSLSQGGPYSQIHPQVSLFFFQMHSSVQFSERLRWLLDVLINECNTKL